MTAGRVNPNPPRSPREVEEFFLQVAQKLTNSDSSLADEEQKSSIPFIGYVREVDRRISDVERLVSSRATRVSELERRVLDLEKMLTFRAGKISELERDIEDLKRSV